MKGFYQKISQILEDIIKKEYEVELDPPLWEVPSRQDFGDLSTMVSLKLASKLKKDPLEVATNLKTILEGKKDKSIEKIEIIKPGFVNIFFAKNALINSLNELIESREKFFRRSIKKKVILEFLSANPTGPLSIAHGRQAVVGDCLGNILDFCGADVEREYYVNDAGKQLELFIRSVEERIKEIKGENFQIPEGGYQGEYVKDVAKAVIEANPKDPKRFALDYVLGWIKKDLKDLGIEFDTWTSQQKIIDDKKIEKVINELKGKDLIYEKEDALWFSSTKFGDDKDRVIKKNDGELTYFASDIAYHEDKINRGANELINLWGPDHHGYIERVKSAIEALGYEKNILKVIIIQLVTLKSKEKMSKRKGTAILLSELVKEVGKDTTRFYYLTRKNSSHLDFDIDLAKATSFDNPLYYIQYSCARIESIFEKAQDKKADPECSEFLKSEEELCLLRALLQFSYTLEKAYYSLEPVFIIEYLKSIAALFHKFYETNRVLGESENVEAARLNLLKATRIVLHCGLALLGITPAKKM
ncbi:MAG: arginine--tRNA ligase [Candidatus Omnitrophica bacterium]|nr:arginine--tRNA ligase [Candidatus Omnitrophota bacterium]